MRYLLRLLSQHGRILEVYSMRCECAVGTLRSQVSRPSAAERKGSRATQHSSVWLKNLRGEKTRRPGLFHYEDDETLLLYLPMRSQFLLL